VDLRHRTFKQMGLHWKTFGEKNATDCGMRGCCYRQLVKKVVNVVVRQVEGRNTVLFSGFCRFLVELLTSKLSHKQNLTKWRKKN